MGNGKLKNILSKGKKAATKAAEYAPIVGSVIDNINSEDGGRGTLDKGKLWKSLVRIGGTIALTILGQKIGVDLSWIVF